jgi:steroid delta-isomerase
VRFDDAGRVAWHRDYWDAAEELYAKLPVVGAVVRMLRRRGAAPAA